MRNAELQVQNLAIILVHTACSFLAILIDHPTRLSMGPLGMRLHGIRVDGQPAEACHWPYCDLKAMSSHLMCIIWWRRIAAKARILIHQELDNTLLTQLNNAAWTPQVVDGVKMSP